jgi:nucleoside-triphosphatase
MLLLNIILIVTALTVFNMGKLPLTAGVVVVIATFWIFKYPKVLRPLKKPGFWIFFVITTMLSAYLFTSFSTGKSNGWIIGLEMNLRAIVMILGFAVTGRELRNPTISKWLNGAGLKQLPYALELAFESLPAVISNMPGWKEIMRKPITSFSLYIYKANRLLELHEKEITNLQKLIIVTGEIGEGKTSYLKKIIADVKAEGIEIKGFLSPVVFDDKIKTGYNLLNITDNTEMNFIREKEPSRAIKFRKYYFSNEGIAKGNNILLSYKENVSGILVIDEIGPWELEGRGWAECLNKLTELPQYKMIWIVRKEILEVVIKKWNLQNPAIIDISQTTFGVAKEIIIKLFA